MGGSRWLPFPMVVGRLTVTVQQTGIAIEGFWARGGRRDHVNRQLLQSLTWIAAQKADEVVSGVAATMMADGTVRLALVPPSEGARTMSAGRLLEAVAAWLRPPPGGAVRST